jgi:hypothetical protein
MPDKVLLSLVVASVLFMMSGGLIVGVAIRARNNAQRQATLDTVAINLLLMKCPLTGESGPKWSHLLPV